VLRKVQETDASLGSSQFDLQPVTGPARLAVRDKYAAQNQQGDCSHRGHGSAASASGAASWMMRPKPLLVAQ
jgi:hypothetical protein